MNYCLLCDGDADKGFIMDVHDFKKNDDIRIWHVMELTAGVWAVVVSCCDMED